MIDIEKMEAAALAATQGEWVVSDHIYASDGKRIASYQMISRDDGENEANATHIATANPAAVLELIEKYKALEAENERLKPRHEAYVKMLGELLAVLHADGGHYQYEHGTEKAVADAITKYYELVKQLDEYKRQSQNEAEIKQLEIALRIKTEEHQCCAEDLISLSKSEQDGWKEAAIAWEVCASIHEKWAKGKDTLYSTRHADFEKHADDARRKLPPNA